MKLKNLKLKNRFFLAPMLEPNDIAFRLLCKKAGAGLVYTGMTNPLSQQKIILDDKPAIQLFATSKKGIKKFIKKHDSKVKLWDFNLGCPSDVAEKLGFGVFMHKETKTIEKILKTIRQNTKKPVTIKIRKSENYKELINIAEKYCDAIAVHARTQKQGYSGEPDIDFARKIKSLTKLPIIYSGNVNEKNAKDLLKEFDFLMIGREAIGNPNIFAKLTNKKINLTFKDYLKLAKKYNLYFRNIKMQAMWFTKSMKNAKQLRRKLVYAKNIQDIESVMNISSMTQLN